LIKESLYLICLYGAVAARVFQSRCPAVRCRSMSSGVPTLDRPFCWCWCQSWT